jgi:hypothetical protein
MTKRCKYARAGFELGSPDYQKKVISPMLGRDHQFKVIWVELYVAVRHIGPPKSWNWVSKTDREVIKALERKSSRGCSTGRGG